MTHRISTSCEKNLLRIKSESNRFALSVSLEGSLESLDPVRIAKDRRTSLGLALEAERELFRNEDRVRIVCFDANIRNADSKIGTEVAELLSDTTLRAFRFADQLNRFLNAFILLMTKQDQSKTQS
jgi:hypothetical protein